MFAKTIIDSDAFLDMPQSTQLLYFHLSMRADDDGFINNPKSIARNVKCNEDDLKILAMKKFIIPFESGIVVIKHWKIHNYIRADRYKETKYKEEKNQLMLDENKAYTVGIPSDNQVTTNGIPSDNQMDTQVRLGKDSIGKNYIYNSNTLITEKAEKKPKVSYQQIVDKYNEICKSLPKVMKLSDTRRKAINARLDKFSLEEIITVFEKAEQSNFLKGANNRNWKADFDWLMSDRNMAKVLEGKYDNCNALKDNSATVTSSNTNTKTYTPKTTNRFNNFEQRQYSDDELDALERKLLSR